jgi:hypothetical protein
MRKAAVVVPAAATGAVVVISGAEQATAVQTWVPGSRGGLTANVSAKQSTEHAAGPATT